MIIKHPSKEFIETIINGPEPVTKEFKDECIRLSKLNKILITKLPGNIHELKQECEFNREDFLFDQLCILIHRVYDLENEVEELKKLAV